ncbi:hypothetical protein [Luteolibacter sp. Populi]|uniref:hypothetical protein n=1 Tax=Luteolibacter sp. Populi TaxID=3230487 RepID=UPI0034654EFA
MKAISPLRLVTLPVLALAVLPSCKRNSDARMDPDWWRLEADRVELVQEIKLLKMRLGEETAGKDHSALTVKVAKDQTLLGELKATAEAIRTDISGLAAAAQKQRDAWVSETRANAIGRNFESLAGASGRTYEDVVITKISDVGIEFRHSTGSARLPATELNSALHDVFALDAGDALAAIEKERAAARVYEAWIDNRMVSVDAERKETQRIAAERESDRVLAAAQARSDARATSLASNDSKRSRLHDEPRAFSSNRGNTTWYPNYYSGNRYYYPSSNCGPRLNGSVGNYARAFAVTVSGGCGYTPRITPVQPGGRPNYVPKPGGW